MAWCWRRSVSPQVWQTPWKCETLSSSSPRRSCLCCRRGSIWKWLARPFGEPWVGKKLERHDEMVEIGNRGGVVPGGCRDHAGRTSAAASAGGGGPIRQGKEGQHHPDRHRSRQSRGG